MKKHTGVMKYLYIEYADHREFIGSTDRPTVYAENFARSVFVGRKAAGIENVHNWVVEGDGHKVICWGTDGPAHYEGI